METQTIWEQELLHFKNTLFNVFLYFTEWAHFKSKVLFKRCSTCNGLGFLWVVFLFLFMPAENNMLFPVLKWLWDSAEAGTNNTQDEICFEIL